MPLVTDIMRTLTEIIDIDAPIETVWRVLTNFDDYENWNRFTPKVETLGRMGDPVTLHVRLNNFGPLTKSNLVIAQIEPFTLCWGSENFFIKAHRTQSLTRISERKTRYESREPFAGLLAPLILWLYETNLMRGYKWAAVGLKAEAEKQLNKIE